MTLYTLFAIFTLGGTPSVIIPNLTHEACEKAVTNMRNASHQWDLKPMCLAQGSATPMTLER
jgi:hypothetical protein